MNPFKTARIRHILQQLTLNQTEAATSDALGATTPEVVQQIVASALRGTEV